jgi:hypothetical protein
VRAFLTLFSYIIFKLACRAITVVWENSISFTRINTIQISITFTATFKRTVCTNIWNCYLPKITIIFTESCVIQIILIPLSLTFLSTKSWIEFCLIYFQIKSTLTKRIIVHLLFYLCSNHQEIWFLFIENIYKNNNFQIFNFKKIKYLLEWKKIK